MSGGQAPDWPAWHRRPTCPVCLVRRGTPCRAVGETTAAEAWGRRPGDELSNPHRARRIDRLSDAWLARRHLPVPRGDRRPRPQPCLAARPGLVTVLCVRVCHDVGRHRGPGGELW